MHSNVSYSNGLKILASFHGGGGVARVSPVAVCHLKFGPKTIEKLA